MPSRILKVSVLSHGISFRSLREAINMWKILLLLPFLLQFASVDAPHNATLPNALHMSSVTFGLTSLEDTHIYGYNGCVLPTALSNLDHHSASRHFVLPFALLSALFLAALSGACLLYTSPSPRDRTRSRMPSSA